MPILAMHPGPGAEDSTLAQTFEILASLPRLSLLRQLRTPRTLGALEVQPQAGEVERNMARQSVRRHLDRLLEAGMVEARPAQHDARSPLEYVVNHQSLFALSERIRELARLRPAVEPRRPTEEGTPPRRPLPRGPCLVLVKGLDEGTTFLLRDEEQPWIVGRKRGLAVSLEFDPFVSAENSQITWEGSFHVLQDLPNSRNGTSLNFQPLAQGDALPLRHGDVIGLGKSLLLYRRE